MLEFSNEFTCNKEVDLFLRNFCNNAIKNKLYDIIICFEGKMDIDETYYDEDMLEEYFPANWPGSSDDKLYIMKGLYALLNSNKEFVPTLIMEYIMAAIIEEEISRFDDLYAGNMDDFTEDLDVVRDGQDVECGLPFTENTYKKIKTAYYEYYLDGALENIKDERKKQDMIKNAEESAEYMVESVWHFSPEWFDFCFRDEDYTYLDEMTIGELRHSPLNAALRIVHPDPSYDEFYLPDDWENSKDFHYLNRPDNDNDDTLEKLLTELH